MNTRKPLPFRYPVASTLALFLVGLIVLSAWTAGLKIMQAAPEPTPAPTVTHVVPEPVPACADAAQWYYEHYVALVAESRALAAGDRKASPEWLAERIEPAMSGEPEAFDQLQACREAVAR